MDKVEFFFSLLIVNLVCDCRLDVYIYDYLLKRNLQTTAKAFMAEGKVAADPVGNGHAFFKLIFKFVYVFF